MDKPHDSGPQYLQSLWTAQILGPQVLATVPGVNPMEGQQMGSGEGNQWLKILNRNSYYRNMNMIMVYLNVLQYDSEDILYIDIISYQ